jgi:hypothetical protein
MQGQLGQGCVAKLFSIAGRSFHVSLGSAVLWLLPHRAFVTILKIEEELHTDLVLFTIVPLNLDTMMMLDNHPVGVFFRPHSKSRRLRNKPPSH